MLLKRIKRFFSFGELGLVTRCFQNFVNGRSHIVNILNYRIFTLTLFSLSDSPADHTKDEFE